MADSSIDDFFAKKDKSKKKGKSKFTPGDVLNEQKEKPKKTKTKKPKEEKPPPQQTETPAEVPSTENEKPPRPTKDVGDLPNKKDDEEWKDFEDETERDYSGLRIQTLKVGDEEENPEEVISEGEEEEGEGGKPRSSKNPQSGPWNQIEKPPVPVIEEEPPAPPPPAEPAVNEEPSAPKKYVPPGARAAAAAGPSLRRTPLRKKTAPNLESEEDFPTLGGPSLDQQQYESSSSQGARFEKVRSGGMRQVEDHKSQKLELGNRFDSLRGGD